MNPSTSLYKLMELRHKDKALYTCIWKIEIRALSYCLIDTKFSKRISPQVSNNNVQ